MQVKKIYITGNAYKPINFGAGSLGYTSASTYYSFIVKFDPYLGYILGSFHTILGPQVTTTSIAVGVDAIFVGAAFTYIKLNGNLVNSTNMYPDSIVVKYDLTGQFVWNVMFGSDNIDQPNALAVSSDLYVYVCGQFKGTLAFDNTDVWTDKNAFNSYALRIDQKQIPEWYDHFGQFDNSSVICTGVTTSIFSDHDNQVYFTGTYGHDVTFGTKSYVTNEQSCFIVAYNPPLSIGTSLNPFIVLMVLMVGLMSYF